MEGSRKQGFLLEDYRLFHLSSPGGVTTEPHYHEFFKILFLLGGSGYYFVDGHRYRLCPGDVVLLPAGMVHRPALNPEEGYERVILYLSRSYLEGLSTAFLQPVDIFSQGPILRPRNNRLTRQLSRLERAISEEGFGKDLLCQAELVKLLVLLGRCPENALSPEPLMPRNPRVRQLLAFLDDHFTEELSIDDLARQFFVSKYHMMRLFREETGVTIHQYILHKRLMLARSYLASGMNATQSCYRSGFGSYSAFTRACARLLGRSPTGRATPEPDE